MNKEINIQWISKQNIKKLFLTWGETPSTTSTTTIAPSQRRTAVDTCKIFNIYKLTDIHQTFFKRLKSNQGLVWFGLVWFHLTLLCDWSRILTPSSQWIRCKTNNWNLVLFFFAYFHFKFWLANNDVKLCSDWLLGLLKVWFFKHSTDNWFNCTLIIN